MEVLIVVGDGVQGVPQQNGLDDFRDPGLLETLRQAVEVRRTPLHPRRLRNRPHEPDPRGRTSCGGPPGAGPNRVGTSA